MVNTFKCGVYFAVKVAVSRSFVCSFVRLFTGFFEYAFEFEYFRLKYALAHRSARYIHVRRRRCTHTCVDLCLSENTLCGLLANAIEVCKT